MSKSDFSDREGGIRVLVSSTPVVHETAETSAMMRMEYVKPSFGMRVPRRVGKITPPIPPAVVARPVAKPR